MDIRILLQGEGHLFSEVFLATVKKGKNNSQDPDRKKANGRRNFGKKWRKTEMKGEF